MRQRCCGHRLLNHNNLRLLLLSGIGLQLLRFLLLLIIEGIIRVIWISAKKDGRDKSLPGVIPVVKSMMHTAMQPAADRREMRVVKPQARNANSADSVDWMRNRCRPAAVFPGAAAIGIPPETRTTGRTPEEGI